MHNVKIKPLSLFALSSMLCNRTLSVLFPCSLSNMYFGRIISGSLWTKFSVLNKLIVISEFNDHIENHVFLLLFHRLIYINNNYSENVFDYNVNKVKEF